MKLALPPGLAIPRDHNRQSPGVVTRAISTSVDIDEAKKAATYPLSPISADRHGTIFLASGWDKHLDAFRANPIAIWAHRLSGNPGDIIGQWEVWVDLARGLMGTLTYSVDVPGPAGQMARDVWEMVLRKLIKAVSHTSRILDCVYYDQPKEIAALPDYAKKAFESGDIWGCSTEQQLIEGGNCLVGSNPDALEESVRRGMCSRFWAIQEISGSIVDHDSGRQEEAKVKVQAQAQEKKEASREASREAVSAVSTSAAAPAVVEEKKVIPAEKVAERGVSEVLSTVSRVDESMEIFKRGFTSANESLRVITDSVSRAGAVISGETRDYMQTSLNHAGDAVKSTIAAMRTLHGTMTRAGHTAEWPLDVSMVDPNEPVEPNDSVANDTAASGRAVEVTREAVAELLIATPTPARSHILVTEELPGGLKRTIQANSIDEFKSVMEVLRAAKPQVESSVDKTIKRDTSIDQICPECAAEVDGDALTCSECGADMGRSVPGAAKIPVIRTLTNQELEAMVERALGAEKSTTATAESTSRDLANLADLGESILTEAELEDLAERALEAEIQSGQLFQRELSDEDLNELADAVVALD